MQKCKEITRREMLVLSAGGALGLLGCNSLRVEKKQERERPNLLFVFSDQQRMHALGFMNEDPVITPNIDEFAKESMVFTNAISACPLCAPYRGTLMTGRYPLSTGIIRNGLGLSREEVSIANALKQAGYQTGYIGKWHLYDNGIDDWRDWHFNQRGQFVPAEHRFGFDYWHVTNCNHRTFWQLYYENSEEPVVNCFGWQVEHEVDMAIQYLKNSKKKNSPFALFVSMVPPHNTHGPGFEPYLLRPEYEEIPPLYRTQYHAPKKYEALYRGVKLERRPNVENNLGDIALPGYFGACTGIDEHFGRLEKCLEEQGLAEDTIVVYTSDHGDMMGSHDRFQKMVWYEESIGIPFIIRLPGRIKAGRNDLLFNSVDVMPSLLGLMGVAIPQSVEGTDFSGTMLGHRGGKPSSALIQCASWKGIRTERYTFVADKHPKQQKVDIFFYDNEKDPYQLKPIRKGCGSDALLNKLKYELKGWLERTGDSFADLL